ncbi:MAG: cytidylate kinase-like family protein [Clostridiales bacterium]|nr:cytidylate kinase-like family protein [Clostridiales bacterium]
MAHKVITVTRQFGSLGRVIAKAVADNLGFEYYDRDIIEMAVKELSGDFDKLIEFEGQKISIYDKMRYPLGRGNAYAKRALFEMERSVMVELAHTKDCVIVGRCSDFVLRKYGVADANMLNVFIYAPIEKRLSICKEELNIEDPGEAYTYLTKVDKAREEFYKDYTKHKFTSHKFRHLMIDSSMADHNKIAEIITSTAKIKFGLN